jgi:hypothetical protein
MALVVRNTDPVLSTIATAYNALKVQVGPGSAAHLDVAEYFATAIMPADAVSTLAEVLVLANQLRALSLIHRADTLIHKAVDSATITAPAASDQTTANTLLNELKADHNVHNGSTSIHFNAESSTDIATTDASTLGTSVTLANAIKAAYIAHGILAPTRTGYLIRLVGA